MPQTGSGPHPPTEDKLLNILSAVKKMAIWVLYPEVKKGSTLSTQQISEYLTIKFMKNIRNYSPVLEPNPSVLDNRTAPLADMPQAIQLLYGYLKDCSITNLPDFKAKNDEQIQRL